MALRLLRSTETKDVKVSGTTFRVRKIPHGLAVVLTRKHTERGRLNEDAFARDFWLHALVGWDGLLDAAGRPLPFSRDPVEVSDPATGAPVVGDDGQPRREPLPYAVALSLPGQVADLLAIEARSIEVVTEEALGNSQPSSASA